MLCNLLNVIKLLDAICHKFTDPPQFPTHIPKYYFPWKVFSSLSLLMQLSCSVVYPSYCSISRQSSTWLSHILSLSFSAILCQQGHCCCCCCWVTFLGLEKGRSTKYLDKFSLIAFFVLCQLVVAAVVVLTYVFLPFSCWCCCYCCNMCYFRHFCTFLWDKFCFYQYYLHVLYSSIVL